MFITGYALREEPCTDPYARFCGQTEAAASSDPITRHLPLALSLAGFEVVIHLHIRHEVLGYCFWQG